MNNKLIMSIIGIAIGVILVGSVLAPVIDEAQDTAGNPILFQNTGTQTGARGGYNEITPSTHMIYEVTASGVTINGQPFSYSSAATWGTVIVGEHGAALIRVETLGGQINIFEESSISTPVNVLVPYTITLEGDKVTIGEYSLNLGAGYYLDVAGDYSLAVGLTERVGTWYVNSINDVTIYGVYTTGVNNTGYSLVNGQISTAVDYTSKVNYTLTPVDGTTDVFVLSDLKIDIGGEEFVPYNSIIIKTCYGHETKGGMYSLYGAIPVIVIVALLISAIAIIRERN